MHGLLHDIGVAVIAATAFGLIAHFLRQPIILGYLIAGALIGPGLGFGLVEDEQNIEIISEIGLILLLFIIGLEMKLGELLSAGKQLLVAGFGQFVMCAVLGLGFFMLLGYSFGGGSGKLDGLYLALVCGLSSTAIVVKLLYDKFELDTLSGRLTIGILVIQDVYAILVLALQPNLSNPQALPIIKALAGSGLLLVAGFLISKWILRHIFAAISKSPEMVVATSIGWCALVAGGAGAMGLSQEMGALIAGLSISAFPYSLHVTAKTLPLRDFFLTLFFMSLGMKITAPRLDLMPTIVAVVGFVIVSRFLSVYPLLAWCGAGRRTCFITSLNLAQLSEFSLVIAALGVTHGHLGADTVAALIYAMAITAVLSSYAIRFSHPLFGWYHRLLSRAGMATRSVDRGDEATCDHHPVALLGFHRGARALIDELERRNPELLRKVLVIDYNPEVLRELKARGVAGHFGDISSIDTLKHAHLDHATLILSTIPDMLLKGTDNLSLVKSCRAFAPAATILATVDLPEHEARMTAAGASAVIQPHALVGAHLAGLVETTLAG